jgi:hypothetical protein
MTKSPKRLLLVAVSALALALVVAPVSFAGEDDGVGPTQAGEIQGPIENSPASSQGPAVENSPAVQNAPSGATKSNNNSGSSKVLGASRTAAKKVTQTTRTRDVVRATGGVQAGFGGMAAAATSNSMSLAGALGILLILAGAATVLPNRLRTQR